jgi:hypothetical protein
MPYFLVRQKKADTFVPKGKAAEQTPLAGYEEAGRRLSLLCPWINQRNLAAMNQVQELCL